MNDSKLHFHFITLFPETIEVWFRTSILGRGLKNQLFSFEALQLRDFATDSHKRVDDTAYGGGGGMVLKIEPLVKAVESLYEKYGRENVYTIYFSPAGQKLEEKLISKFSSNLIHKHLVLICGHYEGIDERFVNHWVDCQISLGDFVMTGGEIPAIAFADALVRKVHGVLGYDAAPEKESFSLRDPNSNQILLEYPQYTRPKEFRGLAVPEVLLNGNHQDVEEWRLEKSIERTRHLRPDLMSLQIH